MPDTSGDFRSGEDAEAAHAAQGVDERVTGADAGPIDEDAMRAADGLSTSPEQESHYREMVEKGAHQKGEGAVP